MAEEMGLKPGDRVVAINGHKLADEVDYRFYAADDHIVMDVVDEHGDVTSYEIEKDPDDLLGISFAEPLFDRVRTCRNNCVFCFIRQLPRGLRKGLYVRDDDYRLSFLFGNFVTLTNMTKRDFERVISQRLSPLRVSVHTTDGHLRKRLMRNDDAASIMDHLTLLTQAGIEIHVQVVVLRDINDGKALEDTLRDLECLGENIVSVGLVPAIYTRYRPNPPSRPGDRAWAGSIIDMVGNWQKRMRTKWGKNWVYAADEFYVMSERPIPDYREYDGFPQYENGIGIIADFRRDVEDISKSGSIDVSKRVLVATGTMAAAELERAFGMMGLAEKVRVMPLANTLFGHSVTCAGLITGQDLVAAALREMRANREFDILVVPSVSLTDGCFVDGFSLQHIGETLGIPVLAVKPYCSSLLEGIR